MTHFLTTCRIAPFGLALMAVVMCGAQSVAAQVVQTDGDLTVTFSQLPLFSAPDTTNIAPGITQLQTVTIQNNGANTEAILLSVANESSTGLADGVTLVVEDDQSTIHFSDTFDALFASTPVTLGELAAGASRTYTLVTAFASSSGNTYQGTTMSFDLLFGFASGAAVSTGGGGGGGGGGTATTDASPDGIVAGTATTSAPLTSPNWWDPVQDFILGSVRGAAQSVLGYGKGAFGAPSYDEWRSELDAERAAELEQAELAAASGTATSATTQTANGEGIDTWTDRLGTNFSWWILIFLGVLLAGFGWTYRRSYR